MIINDRPPELSVTFGSGSHLLISQAYTSKRRILIQVLPVPNAYTKSGDAYIQFAKSSCCLLMHICIFIAILRQNAYMYE